MLPSGRRRHDDKAINQYISTNQSQLHKYDNQSTLLYS